MISYASVLIDEKYRPDLITAGYTAECILFGIPYVATISWVHFRFPNHLESFHDYGGPGNTMQFR